MPLGKKSEKIADVPHAEADTSLKQRFGAVAFVETFEEMEDDPDDSVLSLDTLRAAFASMEEMEIATHGNDEGEFEEFGREHENGSDDFGDDGLSVEIVKSSPEHSVELSPKNILEAMLFVGNRENRPLAAERAAEKMRNVVADEIDRIADKLDAEYGKQGSPYMIQRDHDGYRMVLRPEFRPVFERFYGKIREATLSQPAIDTLAVVAYRQPVSADDVQNIRKQPSSAILSQLVRRGLIELVGDGKSTKKGAVKTVAYRTTERFLELFQLESIDDLPMPEEIDFR